MDQHILELILDKIDKLQELAEENKLKDSEHYMICIGLDKITSVYRFDLVTFGYQWAGQTNTRGALYFTGNQDREDLDKRLYPIYLMIELDKIGWVYIENFRSTEKKESSSLVI